MSNAGRIINGVEYVYASYHQQVVEELRDRVKETVKAFGGCTNCYGKGYSTQFNFSRQRQTPKYCDCPRGKALELMIKETGPYLHEVANAKVS